MTKLKHVTHSKVNNSAKLLALRHYHCEILQVTHDTKVQGNR